MSISKQLQCLTCGRELQWAYTFAEESINLIDDAGEVHILFGYGSAYDNDVAHAFICDECFGSDVVRARLYSYLPYEAHKERA